MSSLIKDLSPNPPIEKRYAAPIKSLSVDKLTALQCIADWLPHSLPVTKMILPQLFGDLSIAAADLAIERGHKEWKRIRAKYPDEMITEAIWCNQIRIGLPNGYCNS